MAFTSLCGLRVDDQLVDFVQNEALPGTGIEASCFWADLSALIAEMGPPNRALLARRDDLQDKIDAWHKETDR